nr:unnamed protein product [Naegleria fowleri]
MGTDKEKELMTNKYQDHDDDDDEGVVSSSEHLNPMPTELHSHSLSVNNNNKDQPNDDSTPPMMTTTDSSNKSSTSVLTDDQLLKLLLNHQKDYGALGANLFLVMIVFGVIFCWERGLKTYITITLVEFILQTSYHDAGSSVNVLFLWTFSSISYILNIQDFIYIGIMFS